MQDQRTSEDVINNEKQTVAKLLNLGDISQVKLNDRGWDSRVYAVDEGKYYFKFPRSEKVRGRYKYEKAALKMLEGKHCPVKLPKILYECAENTYCGYSGVAGRHLNEVASSLSDHDKVNVGVSLGEFLKIMHSTKVDMARKIDLQDEIAQVQKYYEGSSRVLIENLTHNEQNSLQKLVYDSWPKELVGLGYNPVYSHGDYHFENVLYQEDGTIGVVDFGDAGYYDESRDFADINDKQILQSMLLAYGNKSQDLIDKIELRVKMFRIVSLGFYIGKTDIGNIRKTIDSIRSFL